MQTAQTRLLDAAERLFAVRGFANVGINEVIGEADVAKMSLYNNFSSKEALAVAVFERLSNRRRAAVTKAISLARSTGARIDAMFAVALEIATEPEFRGCAFLNLAAQAAKPDGALHAVVRRHKQWLRDTFAAIANQSGCNEVNSESLPQQWLALWDGGIAEAYVQGSLDPIRNARDAAQVLWRYRADGAVR